MFVQQLSKSKIHLCDFSDLSFIACYFLVTKWLLHLQISHLCSKKKGVGKRRVN